MSSFVYPTVCYLWGCQFHLLYYIYIYMNLFRMLQRTNRYTVVRCRPTSIAVLWIDSFAVDINGVERVFAPGLCCPPALLALRGERSCTGPEQEYRLSKNGKSHYCTAIARCSEFARGPFPTATVVTPASFLLRLAFCCVY